MDRKDRKGMLKIFSVPVVDIGFSDQLLLKKSKYAGNSVRDPLGSPALVCSKLSTMD